MIRTSVFPLVLVLLCPWLAAPTFAQSEEEEAATEDTEPVYLNSAVISDLLALPGMDEDLAREILAVRDSLGGLDTIEDLHRNPAISPARLLPLRSLLLVEPGKKNPSRLETGSTIRSVSSGEPKGEIKTAFRSERRSVALRIRRQAPEKPEITARLSARLPGGLSMTAGHLTPSEGLGLLVGVSNRPAPRGVLVSSGAASVLPPPSGGRVLRGVQLSGFRFLSIGVLDIGGDEESAEGNTKVLLLRGNPGVAFGAAGFSPAVVRQEGRLWAGVTLAGVVESASWMFETARDPRNLWRYGFTASSRGAGPFRVALSAAGGARSFRNPLGIDFESGRNDNRNETTLRVRARLRRGVALELETRAALEGATTRRAWDRATGYGRARLEASLGSGWSLLSETRVENRSAPGPTGVADAPLRRHAGTVRLGWERGRDHLRVEWQGRLDFSVPRDPSDVAVIDAVSDVVQVRGRRALSDRIRIGGGVSRFQTPPASPATLYEERPPGLYRAVFVRGTGSRVHASLEVALGSMSGGVFAARESSVGGPVRESWGVSFRFMQRFSQPLAPIDSRRDG